MSAVATRARSGSSMLPATPLRIVWVNDRASFHGGAERYVHAVVRGLAALGIESILLYDPNQPHDPAYTSAFSASFPLVDPSLQLLRLDPDALYVHRVAHGDTLRELAGIDVPSLLFFHDHAPFCLREHKYTAVGGRTCTRPLGPHCYVCTGGLVRGREGQIELASLARKRRYLAAHRGFDDWVVGSRYMAGHLELHRFPPERIRVLPLFSDLPDVARAGKREPRNFLFVGGLMRGKGLDHLLHAFAQLPGDTQLTVVGSGPQGPQLERLVSDLALGSRVRFLGRLAPEEIVTWYDRATCLVLPSRAPETFGLVGVEAMARGTPVIASRVGATPEWLQHEVTGLLVPSGDRTALARALRRILDESDEAMAFGRAGRAAAQSHFRLEHHLQGLVRVFESVAHRSAA